MKINNTAISFKASAYNEPIKKYLDSQETTEILSKSLEFMEKNKKTYSFEYGQGTYAVETMGKDIMILDDLNPKRLLNRFLIKEDGKASDVLFKKVYETCNKLKSILRSKV